MKRFQAYLREANAIDTMQGVLDVATLGGSFIPGLNLASAATQSISAGVDALQGQYGQGAMRLGQAGLSAIPFGRAAGAASKLGRLARLGRVAKVAGAVATTAGPAAAKWIVDKLSAGQRAAGPGVEGGVGGGGGGGRGFVSSLSDKNFDVIDVPRSLVHDIKYKN